jgi:hypothetical protein
MAGNVDYNRLTSTTIEKYIPRFEDNIFTSKPLLFALTTFGSVETLDGGTEIVQPLMYAELRNQGSYTGSDPFLTDEDDGFTAAEFDWAQYYGLIRLKNIELAKNSGAPAVLKILENEMKRAELSISQSLNEMFYGDGTGNGGKDWNGLDLIVSDSVSFGGIDPTAAGNDWWQSSVTGSIGDITDFTEIRQKYLAVSEGNDLPTNIMTTEALYAHIDSMFESNQRFMDPRMADQGFETLLFHGCPIAFDRDCQSGRIYFLNLDYITLNKLGPNWFKTSEWMEPVNQDIRLKKILLYGQLTASNRARQGLLSGVTVPSA